MNTRRRDESILLGEPIVRDKDSIVIARKILLEISKGNLTPGSRLPSERVLANQFDVGRSAVREALATLDLLGLLGSRPGDGNYITSATSDIPLQTIEWGLLLGRPQTLDLVETRRYLEAVIAELAAQRITPQGKESLADCLSRMERTREDIDEFTDADVSFHLALATIAENSVLKNMLQSIRALLQVWIRRTVTYENVDETIRQHREISEAVASGNPLEARKAMEAHMAEAAQRLSDQIAKEGIE